MWTVSDSDRDLVLQDSRRSAYTTFTVPNGVDTARFLPMQSTSEGMEILYVGAFRHRPNVIAFERLCRDILPRVWERYPDALLQVVAGPRHEQFHPSAPLDPRIPRIRVRRRPAPARRFRDRRYSASPVLRRNHNIKIMEAMACGKCDRVHSLGLRGARTADDLELSGPESAPRLRRRTFANCCRTSAHRTALGSAARAVPSEAL